MIKFKDISNISTLKELASYNKELLNMSRLICNNYDDGNDILQIFYLSMYRIFNSKENVCISADYIYSALRNTFYKYKTNMYNQMNYGNDLEGAFGIIETDVDYEDFVIKDKLIESYHKKIKMMYETLNDLEKMLFDNEMYNKNLKGIESLKLISIRTGISYHKLYSAKVSMRNKMKA